LRHSSEIIDNDQEELMNKKYIAITSVVIFSMILLSACSGVAAALSSTNSPVAQAASSATATSTTSSSDNSSITTGTNTVSPIITIPQSQALTDWQNTLESIYSAVSPQVVTISVTSTSSSGFSNFPGFNNNQSQITQGLGSGFIWDTNGNIVTNDHVVNGATSIEVTFSDGTTVPAKIVGEDPYSDLAVINVSGVPASLLTPVTIADSSQVKVGEFVAAIGNPYGLQESMSTGIVSGLGRDIPNSNTSQSTSSASYSIPDIIQTDAAINPGNSGGVLVNDLGQVIGVTYSLESSSGSSSGIGFAIPSEIVDKVVPALISKGTYSHPYMGISGTDVTADIAKAMNLPSTTRGALIEQVVTGGPAANAGLQGSNTVVTINGVQGTVGGDVITAINGTAITSMSDLITYLELNTQVGQNVTLTIIRNGQTQSVQVTLGTRPSQ
jgi:S1-C subfamily serine protease